MRHKHWPKIQQIISSRVEYPLKEVSKEDWKNDLDYMMKRGNHKSALAPKDNTKSLMDNYTSDVVRRLILPLPVQCQHTLTGATIIPIRVHTQFPIDSTGKKEKNTQHIFSSTIHILC